MANTPDLGKMSVADLRTLATALEIQAADKLKKPELITAIEKIANATQTVAQVPQNVIQTEVNLAESPSEERGPKRKRIPVKEEVIVSEIPTSNDSVVSENQQVHES